MTKVRFLSIVINAMILPEMQQNSFLSKHVGKDVHVRKENRNHPYYNIKQDRNSECLYKCLYFRI